MDPSGTAYLRMAYPLTRIREAMRRHVGRVLDFAVGSAQESPPAWVGDFVREHASLALKRRTVDEVDAFAAAVAAMLEQVYGARVTPRQILPAPSGRAAMGALTSALVHAGDCVLVTEPGYPAFARVASHAGAAIVVVPLDPCHEFAPDMDAVPDAVLGSVRLAGLNYPNNPTGAILTPPALDRLRRRLPPEAVVFNDAVYGPLAYDRAPVSLLSDDSASTGPSAFVELHSLGKLFSLGPLGIAFLVGSEDEVTGVDEYGDFVWSQISSLQIRLATRCLESWDHVDATRNDYRRRLERLREAVSSVGFRPYPTPAGMYLLCPCPDFVGNHRVESAAEGAEILLRNHGIAVVPWDLPPNRYLRFAASASREDLEALLALGSSGRLVVS